MDESTITAFPLAWPRGYERTPKECRQRSAFGTTKQKVGGVSRWMSRERLSISKAVSRLDAEIRRFTKAGRPWRIVPEEVVISSNLRTRLDGLPMGNQPEPSDVGVAIYFRLDGQLTVMCCDKWDRVADNINSVAATLDAMRALERYGVSQSERAFTGFAALPAPGEARARTCWEVLGIACTQDRKAIDEAYRKRANVCHPDRPGGSHDAMTELNTARDQALLQAHETW